MRKHRISLCVKKSSANTKQTVRVIYYTLTGPLRKIDNRDPLPVGQKRGSGDIDRFITLQLFDDFGVDPDR